MKKLYKVIFEDSENVYREFIPADNKEAAAAYISGNGEIITIQDVTEDYPISLDKIADALNFAGFGKVEKDAIIRMVQQYSNTI